MADELYEKGPTVIKMNEDGSVQIGETFYKTVDDALQGKLKADEHINIIQVENKELRDKNTELLEKQGGAMSSLLERMDERKKRQEEAVHVNDEGYQYEEFEQTPAKSSNPNTLTGGQVEEITQSTVQKMLNDQEQERLVKDIEGKFDDNRQIIRKQLTERLGSEEEASAAWQTYKQSPAFDEEIYKLQVLKRPEELLDRIAPPKQTGQQSTDFRTVSSMPGGTTIAPGQVPASKPQKRSYYSKMMLEKERDYWKPETQIRMKADLAALGKEVFFDIK